MSDLQIETLPANGRPCQTGAPLPPVNRSRVCGGVTRSARRLPLDTTGLFGHVSACYDTHSRGSGGKTMTLEGNVVNGVIVLDGGARLPEGERVRVEETDSDDLAPPPEPYDREKELAILRESLEDVK